MVRHEYEIKHNEQACRSVERGNNEPGWETADRYRSRKTWRNPDGRDTRSSMRDRTWHDIKPRSKGLLSPPHSRCLLGPPLTINRRQNRCLTHPHDEIQKHRRQHLKVTPKSKSKASERQTEENKSFLNVFVVEKTGVVIFFELTLSNVWCSEWPKPWGKCVCWKSIFRGMTGGSGGVLRLRWRHRMMCWRGRVVKSSNECTWTRFQCGENC